MLRCVYEYGSAFAPVSAVVGSLEKFRTRDAPFEELKTRESTQFAQQFYHIKGAVFKREWSILVTACPFQGMSKLLYMRKALIRVLRKRLQHHPFNGRRDRWNTVTQAWRRGRQVLETDLQTHSLEKMLTA
jgi:hypothetical protein